MTMKEYARLFDTVNNNAGDKLKNHRLGYQQKFLDRGFPDVRDPGWKYTKLRKLKASRPIQHSGKFFLTQNGQAIPPAKLHSSKLSKFSSKLDSVSDDAFIALNMGVNDDELVLDLSSPFFDTAKPILIQLDYRVEACQLKDDHYAVVNPQVTIRIPQGKTATILERYKSNDQLLLNQVTDIILEKGACLNYCKVAVGEATSSNAHYIGHTRVVQKGSSKFTAFLELSGDVPGREELAINLLGEQAVCEARGRFHARRSQQLEYHVNVSHLASQTTSKQLFRGIADDSSRGVFCGQITVGEGLNKVAAQQLSQNILLGTQAEIAARPQLQIDSDDVKCTHGAAVGRLNEMEVFYLISRGIPRSKAESILLAGFNREVVSGIDDAPFVNAIDEWIQIS